MSLRTKAKVEKSKVPNNRNTYNTNKHGEEAGSL